MEFEEKLKQKLNRHFDLEGPLTLGNLKFQFIAKFNQRNVKYVLKKTNEIYAFENNEVILFLKMENLFRSNDMDALEAFFEAHAAKLVNIDAEHMSSAVTVIVETSESIEPALVKRIEKFKFYKSFLFGFKGWINGGLMVINPLENKGLSNRYSKRELEKILS